MRIVITGRSTIFYHKEVEIEDGELGPLVIRARKNAFDALRDYVDPNTDVVDEESDPDDWTLEADGVDALDG